MGKVTTYINKQQQDIECPSCGAIFNIHAPYCPYCDTVNEYGDEELYLKHLENIRYGLEEVSNIPENVYKNEAKSGMKLALKVFLIVFIVLAILIGLVAGLYKYMEVKSANDWEKQVLFEKEYYPKLDKMYADGDYDGLNDFWSETILGELQGYYIWSWDHYEFLVGYRSYKDILDYWEDIKNDPNPKRDDYRFKYGFSNAITLLYDTWEVKYKTVKSMTKEDYDRILEYQITAREFLHEVFGLTDEEIEAIGPQIYQDPPGVGYDYNKIDKVYEKIR